MGKSNSRSKSGDIFIFVTTTYYHYMKAFLCQIFELRVSFVESRKQNWLCQLQMLPIPKWNMECHLAGSIANQSNFREKNVLMLFCIVQYCNRIALTTNKQYKIKLICRHFRHLFVSICSNQVNRSFECLFLYAVCVCSYCLVCFVCTLYVCVGCTTSQTLNERTTIHNTMIIIPYRWIQMQIREIKYVPCIYVN